MSISRREFVAGTAAAILIGRSAETLAARIGGLRVRRDINRLPPNHSIITAYREAVREMKARTDEHSWIQQANIHANRCQHESWLFLPWHRAYLHYFEEAVRAISGKDDFALPYWNWHKDPVLPRSFRISKSPLYDDTRSERIQRGLPLADRIVGREQVSHTTRKLNRMYDLLEKDFDSFAGSKSSWGGLEPNPHNLLHMGMGGHMQKPSEAAQDPIFWPHHAYIDRIWAKWNTTHENSKDWDNENLGQFFDRNRKSIKVSVSDILDTARLGYRYDDVLPKAFTAKKVASSKISKAAIAVNSKISISSRSATVAQLPLNADFQALARPILSDTSLSVALKLKGVSLPSSTNFFVRLFINCPYLDESTSTESIHYVDSFAFFSDSLTHHHKSQELCFDMSHTLTNLINERQNIPDELKVQALVISTDTADNAAHSFSAETVEVNLLQTASSM